jgi:hypothetical protein
MDRHQEWKVICLLQVWKVICLLRVWKATCLLQETLCLLRVVMTMPQDHLQVICLLRVVICLLQETLCLLRVVMTTPQDHLQVICLLRAVICLPQETLCLLRVVMTTPQDHLQVAKDQILYLAMLAQQVDLLQVTCLQEIQWVNQVQWMDHLLVICLLWMIWEKCILIWMMPQLILRATLDQEHQTLWLVTWMEMA